MEGDKWKLWRQKSYKSRAVYNIHTSTLRSATPPYNAAICQRNVWRSSTLLCPYHFTNCIKQASVAVTLLSSILKVLVSNISPNTGYPEVFRDISQSFHARNVSSYTHLSYHSKIWSLI